VSSLFSNLAAVTATILLRQVGRLSPGDRTWIARKLVRDRFSPEARAFASFCTQALHAWKNKQYDLHQNGEAGLLARLAPFGPRVVFDVGANEGEWAIAACTVLPEAEVHAFEIVPAMAEVMAERVARFAERVIVNPVGLSDHSGTVTIYRTAEAHTSTSVLELSTQYEADAGTVVAEQAVVRIGDDYLAEHGIDRIDLLKIDVEGLEEKVLCGFQAALRQQRITLVQFEYGWMNAHNGFTLKSAYAFFEAHGFVLGKLYPEGVAFKPYAYEDEDFLGPNYIACHESRADIIAAIGCEPL
jgi:FkbM family methyltransferase